jgi:hypothetical protein
VQESVKVLAAASAPEVSLPFTAFAPDHAPLAAQLVALVVVQDSEVVWPATTDVGVAVSVRVGVGLTVTDTPCKADPPAPVQDSVKDVVDCNAAVASEPDVALLPDHPPPAVQLVALVLLQVSVEVAP